MRAVIELDYKRLDKKLKCSMSRNREHPMHDAGGDSGSRPRNVNYPFSGSYCLLRNSTV
jgi:hypothetical protein